MVTTTDYGTWNNHGDRTNTTVAATIADAINGGDAEWRERMDESGALDRIESDYRQAINDALPASVSLCGSEFYGPYYQDDRDWDGELDIAETINGINLFAIVETHDIDNATTRAA
jgi:hypothetical protein